MQKKHITFLCVLLLGVYLDVVLGTFSWPILLTVTCAIVVVYEYISPHLYTKR
jgi:hypothetical protein